MHFGLDDESKMLQQMARDFAQKELAPHAAELDEKSRFPTENVKKMAEMGFMGMTVPEQWSGTGMNTFSYCLVMEELSAACASSAVTMSVNNSLYCGPILKYGSDKQKEKYVTPFAMGQKLGAYCLSEPGTGSDAANQKTIAEKKSDHYILKGVKNWITNGPYADAMIVFAMTAPGKRHKGISAFIVEKTFPGFKVGKIEKKLGIRASATSEIILDNCEVPVENLLGKEGDGFYIAMNTLDSGRIGIATQALGIARAAFDFASKYSLEREAFGQPIGHFQLIQGKIADMASRIEASRLLIHRAAWLKDNQLPHSKEAAMAKLFASETATFTTKEAVQILGGYGYSKEYPVERYFRDAKITEIYEGTSEIQRVVIARNVLKEITG